MQLTLTKEFIDLVRGVYSDPDPFSVGFAMALTLGSLTIVPITVIADTVLAIVRQCKSTS
jgi:hypothetical protein